MTRRGLLVAGLGVCLLAAGGPISRAVTDAVGGATSAGYTALAVVDPHTVADGVAADEAIAVAIENGHDRSIQYHWRLERDGVVYVTGVATVDSGERAEVTLPPVESGDVAFRVDEVEHSLHWSVGR